MKNPFRYGEIVGDVSFCNRSREKYELRKYMKNGQNVLVLSERRMGKTSLIKLLLEDIKKEGYVEVVA